MTAVLDLVEDGIDNTEISRPPSWKWLPIVLSFVAGLGIGVMTLGSDQQAVQGDRSDTLEAAIDSDGPGIGIAIAVPGFPDSLVAIAATENSALDRILWQTRAAPTTRAMADGDNVLLDPNAEFIALSSSVPGLDGSLLSMGRFNLIRAISPGVTSYAWHDTESGSLAYSVEDGTGVRLATVNSRGLKNDVDWIGPNGARVIAWGDWGWAIQTSSDTMVLLTPDGDFKDSEVGKVFDSHESGWLFAIEGTEAKLVSSGGGVKRFKVEPDVGIVFDASFAPDADLVAVAGSQGIVILNRNSDERLVISETSASWVTWSSDSRFVLSSARVGIVIYEMATGRRTSVLDHLSIITARVAPSRSS